MIGWLGTAFLMIAAWQIGCKRREGFVWSFLGELAWATVAVQSGRLDLLVLSVTFAILACWNWLAWGTGGVGAACHFRFLSQLALHKWYVFKAGRLLGVGFWQLLVHDLSKLSPAEYMARVRFVGVLDPLACDEGPYHLALHHHFNRNRHHWEYWLIYLNGESIPLPMPEKYVREMVADWLGAGRAKTGDWDPTAWLQTNRGAMQLHGLTEARLESVLRQMGYEEAATLAKPYPF